MNKRKLLKKVLAGSKNTHFAEMVSLVEALGFHLARMKAATTSLHILRYQS